MTAFIKATHLFKTGRTVIRAEKNIPITLADHEYAPPRHVIGYIAGDMNYRNPAMHRELVRVCVVVDGIVRKET